MLFPLCAAVAAAEFDTPRVVDQTPRSSATPASTAYMLPPVLNFGHYADGIEVAGFRFYGNTIFSKDQLQELLSSYIGRRLTAIEFEEIRNRITRLYVDHGYINSGALIALPPDSANYPQNIVPVEVVEGRIGNVNIQGEGSLQKSYIQERLVHGDEIFNMKVMQERFRLLLTDPLFEKINSRIVPGDVPGRAVLDVDIVRARPYSLNLFFNNYRPPSIGAEAVGISVWLRNLTGYGDVLDVTLQHGRGTNPMHVGWSIPLGAYGTSVRMSADKGSSSVIEEPLRSIDIQSKTSAVEVGVSQTLVETLGRKLDVGIAYSERESKTTLLGQAFSFTAGEPTGTAKVKVWRFSQDWTERWDNRALALRSTFSFGSNNVNAANSLVPVANSRYTIWTGQAQFVQNVLQNGAQFLLRSNIQATPDRLLPLERLSIGGVGSVRGYRENALVRDRAYALSAEFMYPLWHGTDDKHSLMLVPFLDMGDGWNRGEKHQKISSVGLGFRWKKSGLHADLYLAHGMKKLPIQTHGNLQDHGIHFQVSYNPF